MSADSLLRKIYYDISSPAAFSSVDRLYREAHARDSKITRQDVESFLSGEIAYTLHRRAVRKFARNPVVARHFRDLAQADLVDVSRYSHDNDDSRFILTLIDVFTKYAYAVPLYRKTGKQVASALESLLHKYRPSNLQTDGGTEFTNAHVQRLLKQHLINYYIARNEKIKCSIVERFQRTLMTKLHKYFTAKGTHTFIDVLADAVNAYNRSYHRSIRMTPEQATKMNPRVLFKHLYGYESEREMLKASRSKSKVKGGQKVRVQENKNRFNKGYMQNFTDAIFTVSNVNTGTARPQYKLKDHRGKTLEGSFYPEEIQSVTQSDRYRVQVLAERKRGRGKQYLVRYLNLDSEPEWIAGSRLEDIS